jgi:molybdopterin-binding protein
MSSKITPTDAMCSKISPTAAMCSKISPIFMENIMAMRKAGINVQDTQYSKLKKLYPKGNQGEVNASVGVQIQKRKEITNTFMERSVNITKKTSGTAVGVAKNQSHVNVVQTWKRCTRVGQQMQVTCSPRIMSRYLTSKYQSCYTATLGI